MKFPHVFIHSGFRCGISRHSRHLPNRGRNFLFSSFDFYFKTSVYYFFSFAAGPSHSLIHYFFLSSFLISLSSSEHSNIYDLMKLSAVFKFKSMVQPVVLFIFFIEMLKMNLIGSETLSFQTLKSTFYPLNLTVNWLLQVAGPRSYANSNAVKGGKLLQVTGRYPPDRNWLLEYL